MLIAFHKPYGVLSQFTPDGSPNRTLAEFGFPKDIYPLGRLDADPVVRNGLADTDGGISWRELGLGIQKPCSARKGLMIADGDSVGELF